MSGENIYDFGGVQKNTSVVYEFQFRNSGKEPLEIAELKCAPGDSVYRNGSIAINWPHKPIKPGKNALITVTYTAKDEIGSFKYDIGITSNATTSNFPLLHLSGAVVPVSSRPAEKYHVGDGPMGLSQETTIYGMVAESVITIISEAAK